MAESSSRCERAPIADSIAHDVNVFALSALLLHRATTPAAAAASPTLPTQPARCLAHHPMFDAKMLEPAILIEVFTRWVHDESCADALSFMFMDVTSAWTLLHRYTIPRKLYASDLHATARRLVAKSASGTPANTAVTALANTAAYALTTTAADTSTLYDPPFRLTPRYRAVAGALGWNLSNVGAFYGFRSMPPLLLQRIDDTQLIVSPSDSHLRARIHQLDEDDDDDYVDHLHAGTFLRFVPWLTTLILETKCDMAALRSSLRFVPHLTFLQAHDVYCDTSPLAGAFQFLPDLTWVDFGSNYIDVDGGRAIATALRHVPKLRHLDCSPVNERWAYTTIGAVGSAAIVSSLRHVPHLTSLRLAGRRDEDESYESPDERDVKMCAQLRNVPDLTDLSWGFSYGADYALLDVLPDLPRLKHRWSEPGSINLYNLTERGARYLSTLLERNGAPCTSALLQRTTISREALDALASHLQHVTQLDFELGYESCPRDLANALQSGHFLRLTTLSITIRDEFEYKKEDRNSLIASLQHFPCLSTIELTVKPSAGGFVILADLVSHAPHLTRLSVTAESGDAIVPNDEPWIGEWLTVCELLERAHGFVSLHFTALDPFCRVLVSSLGRIPQLTALTIECRDLGSTTGSEIARSLQHVPQLQVLEVPRGNYANGLYTIADGFQFVPHLTELNLGAVASTENVCAAIVESLRHVPDLKRFKIEFPEGWKVWGQRTLCATSVAHATLDAMALRSTAVLNEARYDGVSADALPILAPLLGALTSVSVGHEHVDRLHDDPWGEFVAFLGHLPQLTALELSESRPVGEPAERVFAALEGLPHLRKIALAKPASARESADGSSESGTKDTSDIFCFCQSLRFVPQLTSLSFGVESYDGEGLDVLAAHLHHLPLLQTLHVDAGSSGYRWSTSDTEFELEVTSDAISALVAVWLERCHKLQTIYLVDIPRPAPAQLLAALGRIGAGTDASCACTMLELKYLYSFLKDVHNFCLMMQLLPHLTIVAARQCVDPQSCRVLADALRFVPELTMLDVSGGEVGQEGSRALADAMVHVPQLAELWVSSASKDVRAEGRALLCAGGRAVRWFEAEAEDLERIRKWRAEDGQQDHLGHVEPEVAEAEAVGDGAAAAALQPEEQRVEEAAAAVPADSVDDEAA